MNPFEDIGINRNELLWIHNIAISILLQDLYLIKLLKAVIQDSECFGSSGKQTVLRPYKAQLPSRLCACCGQIVNCTWNRPVWIAALDTLPLGILLHLLSTFQITCVNTGSFCKPSSLLLFPSHGLIFFEDLMINSVLIIRLCHICQVKVYCIFLIKSTRFSLR